MPAIDDYDGFLVDLDGVVWTGREPVPGSPEALATMLAAGKEIVFVTNNPSKRPEEYAERLAGIGVEVGPERIVTAGITVARLAAEAAGPGGGALVLGREPLRELVAGEGLRLVDFEAPTEADVVVVSGWRDFTYMTPARGEAGARRGRRAGRHQPRRDDADAGRRVAGDRRDPGGGRSLLREESGDRGQAGAPPLRARALADPGAERVAMIGDRLSSDIAGGHAAGLDTILVLSGTDGSGGSRGPGDSRGQAGPDRGEPRRPRRLGGLGARAGRVARGRCGRPRWVPGVSWRPGQAVAATMPGTSGVRREMHGSDGRGAGTGRRDGAGATGTGREAHRR